MVFTPDTCRWCGKEFTPKRTTQRYCGVPCRMEAMLERRKWRICLRCGKAFRPTRTERRFCSDTCRIRHHDDLRRKTGIPPSVYRKELD